MLNPKNIDLAAVDFTSADSAIAFADRLCETANAAGIFLREGDPERDAATCKLARRTAKDWLKSVRKHMEGKSIVEGRYNVNSETTALDNGKSYSVADALRILPSYDALHRVAYGIPADPAFLNKHVMGAFESRIRGNKDVDPYLLYRQINAGIARRDPLYLGRPLAWSTSMLDRWYKDLSDLLTYPQSNSGGNPKNHTSYYPQGNLSGNSINHPTDSLYDRIQKASILMETDLWAYEGSSQTVFKQHLLNSFRQFYCNIHGLDQKSIAALNILLHTSRRYVAPDLFMSMQQAIKQAV